MASNLQNLKLTLPPDELHRLVRAIARKIRNRYSGLVDRDEAEGWASLGLIQAAERLDESQMNPKTAERQRTSWLVYKGFTCACDEMRSARVVDRRVRGKLVKRIVPTVSMPTTTSRNPGLKGNAEREQMDVVDPNPDNPEVTAQTRDAIQRAMGELDLVPADVIRYFYVCGLPMKVIGQVLAMGESRVSQIHKRAIIKLRSLLHD